MPIVAPVHPFPMADISTQQQQQQQQSRFPLRRAVYIHVSDLTSAYNIDHPKLEQELAKVKEGNEENAIPRDREDDLETADGENSVASIPQPQSKRRSLHPPRAGFNLCVLVANVKVVVDKFRVDKSRVRLAEVEVGDETGIVSLRARDEQIETLQQVSERSGAVVLRNCSFELFQGKHIRIAVTKWGKLTPYPDNIPSTPPPPTKMNKDRNFSSIDLSLVASELMETSPSEASFSPQSQYRMLENPGSRAARQQQTARQQQFQQTQQHRQDRKQQRPKQPGRMSPSRVLHYPESGMAGAPMGGLRYAGLPAFSHSYGDGMKHYPSQGGRVFSHQANAQHLLMQQYEMHQHQLQQMQAFHEQQERNRPMMLQMQAQGMMGSTSFDTTGDYSVSSPVSAHGGQSMHLVGNNPMLIRVSVPGQSQPDPYGSPTRPIMSGAVSSAPASGQTDSFRPYVQAVTQDQGGAFVAVPAAGDSKASPEAWGIPPASGSVISKDDSSVSTGHMNPQATAFSPGYPADPSSQESKQQIPSYGYVPYDTTGAMYSQPPLYNQNVMYVPMSGNTSSTATSTDHSPETKVSTAETDKSAQEEDTKK